MSQQWQKRTMDKKHLQQLLVSRERTCKHGLYIYVYVDNLTAVEMTTFEGYFFEDNCLR